MPVYLADADAGEIPAILKGYPRFHLNKFALDDAGSDYVNLYRLLTKQPSVEKVDIGQTRKLPPLTEQERQTDFTQLVEQILAGIIDVKSDTGQIKAKRVKSFQSLKTALRHHRVRVVRTIYRPGWRRIFLSGAARN